MLTEITSTQNATRQTHGAPRAGAAWPWVSDRQAAETASTFADRNGDGSLSNLRLWGTKSEKTAFKQKQF